MTPLIELLWCSSSSFSQSDKKKKERDKQNPDLFLVLAVTLFIHPDPNPYCPLLQASLECDNVLFWRNLNALLLCGSQWGENPLGCVKSRDLTSNWEREKAFSHLRVPPQESTLSISLQGRIHISQCNCVCVCLCVCVDLWQTDKELTWNQAKKRSSFALLHTKEGLWDFFPIWPDRHWKTLNPYAENSKCWCFHTDHVVSLVNNVIRWVRPSQSSSVWDSATRPPSVKQHNRAGLQGERCFRHCCGLCPFICLSLIVHRYIFESNWHNKVITKKLRSEQPVILRLGLLLTAVTWGHTWTSRLLFWLLC